ncbi:MAG: 6-carboxyhexanoate--CoA ligase [Nitrospirae bacterium]|nr:6-carboxyhexanoate--CoA ligase [Nitrospirota bacterium]
MPDEFITKAARCPLPALYSIRMRASHRGRHISGAEGIINEELVDDKAIALIHRALNHSRGEPDSITVTIERIDGVEVKKIPALPICTCRINSGEAARGAVAALLNHAGIGASTVSAALNIIEGGADESGAALVDAATGERLDTESTGGIRVSRFGIEDEALAQFKVAAAGLLRETRVLEAVMLASKAASGRGVIAELCISDNPGYTTGYVSSRGLGYVRIPHIKKEGDSKGGRVLFIDKGADINALIRYLRHTPVMIDKFGGIQLASKELDELIGIDNCQP